MKAGGVGSLIITLVNLVQITAHAQEDATGTGRHEKGLVIFVAGLFEIFHAIGLGEKAPFVKGINIIILARRLESTQEVAG